MTSYRRPGINVGDVVRIREQNIQNYARLWPVSKDDAMEVKFRQQVVAGVKTYLLHLGAPGGRTILAKPGHLTIAKKNPDLKART